jgi:flagella basal body P-ring formation protein FlgA
MLIAWLVLFATLSRGAEKDGAMPLAVAPQVAMPAVFTIDEATEIETDRIYLGLIADCSGYAKICEEAYGVDLGHSPEPGKHAYLQKAKLERLLSAEWGEAAIEVVSSDTIKLFGAYVEVDGEAVAEALRQELVTKFGPETPFEVRVDKVQMGTPIKVRPMPYTLRFPVLESTEPGNHDWILKHFSGHQNLEVHLVRDRDTGTGESFFVSAQFTLRRLLPVPKANLARGATVRREDLESVMVEIRRESARYAASAAEVVGKRLTRAAPSGSPIQLSQLEVPEVVKRGDLVTLEILTKGLTVTSRVKVMEDGGYGQVIEALHPTTKKRLRVRVVDQSTVEYIR